MKGFGLDFKYFNEKGHGGREVGWGVVVTDPTKDISMAWPYQGKPAEGIPAYMDLHLSSCNFLKDHLFDIGFLYQHQIYDAKDFVWYGQLGEEYDQNVVGVMNPWLFTTSMNSCVGVDGWERTLELRVRPGVDFEETLKEATKQGAGAAPSHLLAKWVAPKPLAAGVQLLDNYSVQGLPPVDGSKEDSPPTKRLIEVILSLLLLTIKASCDGFICHDVSMIEHLHSSCYASAMQVLCKCSDEFIHRH